MQPIHGLLLLVPPGLWMNWLLPPSVVVQPDWAAGILLGAMLAQWRHAWWALPIACVHDLLLYWTLWPGILIWIAIPLWLRWLDEIAGPGLPQRILLLAMVAPCWAWMDWSWPAAWMSVCLSLVLWHLWAQFPLPYRKPSVHA